MIMFGERLTAKDFLIDDIISDRLDTEIDRLQEMVKDIENKYDIDICVRFEWDYKK